MPLKSSLVYYQVYWYTWYMPRASKQRLDNEIWREIHQVFPEFISTFNKTELETFLEEFLTKEEKTMLAKRLVLYHLLLGGFRDYEINQHLKISLETIRLARTSLEFRGKKFRDKVKNLKLTSQTKKEQPSWLELALKSKSDMKARAKLLSGDY